MNKFLVAAALLSSVAAPAFASSIDEEFSDFLKSVNPDLEFTYASRSGDTFYDVSLGKVSMDQLDLSYAEGGSFDLGVTGYRAAGFTSNSVDVVFHPETLKALYASSGELTQDEVCDLFQAPFSFSTDGLIAREGDLGGDSVLGIRSATTVLSTDMNAGVCMLTYDLSLYDMSVITPDGKVEIGSASVVGSTLVDGIEGIANASNGDIRNSFEVTDLAIHIDGAPKPITVDRFAVSGDTDIESLAAFLNTSGSINVLPNFFEGTITDEQFMEAVDLNDLWNGLREINSKTSFSAENVNLSAENAGMVIPGVADDFVANVNISGGLDAGLFKSNIDIEVSPLVSFKTNLQLVLEEAAGLSWSDEPSTLAMNLPLMFKSLEVEFDEYGLDQLVQQQVGASIADLPMGAPNAPGVTQEKKQAVSDWLAKGMGSGNVARFSINPSYEVPVAAMMFQLAGPWSSFARSFNVSTQ